MQGLCWLQPAGSTSLWCRRAQEARLSSAQPRSQRTSAAGPTKTVVVVMGSQCSKIALQLFLSYEGHFKTMIASSRTCCDACGRVRHLYVDARISTHHPAWIGCSVRKPCDLRVLSFVWPHQVFHVSGESSSSLAHLPQRLGTQIRRSSRRSSVKSYCIKPIKRAETGVRIGSSPLKLQCWNFRISNLPRSSTRMTLKSGSRHIWWSGHASVLLWLSCLHFVRSLKSLSPCCLLRLTLASHSSVQLDELPQPGEGPGTWWWAACWM